MTHNLDADDDYSSSGDPEERAKLGLAKGSGSRVVHANMRLGRSNNAARPQIILIGIVHARW